MSDFRMLPTHLEHLSATAEGDWSFAMMSAATAIPSKMARERYGQADRTYVFHISPDSRAILQT